MAYENGFTQSPPRTHNLHEHPSIFGWRTFLFFALALVSAFGWSHFKMLWWDEFMVLWTDSVPTFKDVVTVQSAYPISLDPLLYHLASHLSIDVLGRTAMAIRLPSTLGFFLMQLCIYLFVRRFADEVAAVFAASFPLLTSCAYYSAEGRPYGLLLGLCALTMLLWQTAARRRYGRTGVLIMLAISLAATLNTHYYGVLILVPLAGAELARTYKNKSADIPMWTALVVGASGFALALPFLHAASQFRTNYYLPQHVPPSITVESYGGVVPLGTNFANHQGLLLLAYLLIFGVVFVFVRAKKVVRVQADECVFMVLLAGFPVYGFLFAVLVTHAASSRFFLPGVIGISSLCGLAAADLFRRNKVGIPFVLCLYLLICILGFHHARTAKLQADANRSKMSITQTALQTIANSPDGKLYITDGPLFAFANFYNPVSLAERKLIMVYDPPSELRYDHADTFSLSAKHLQRFTPFQIQSFESVQQQPGEHLFAECPYNWLSDALSYAHAIVTPKGTVFGCALKSVQSGH